MKFIVLLVTLVSVVVGAGLKRDLLAASHPIENYLPSGISKQKVVDAAFAADAVYDVPCNNGNFGAEWKCLSDWTVDHNYAAENYQYNTNDAQVRLAHLKSVTTANTCAIVFRGTEYTREFETSFEFLVSSAVAFHNAQVSVGYKKLFDKILDEGTFQQKIDSSECSGTIWIFGHSMGGGLATLAQIYLDAVGKTAKSITFGGPKIVKGTYSPNYIDLRVFHNWDVIASDGFGTASTYGYEHVGYGLEIDCQSGYTSVWPTYFGGEVCADVHFYAVGIQDDADGSADPAYHSMTSYKQWLQETPPAPGLPKGASCTPGWTSECASGYCETNSCGWFCLKSTCT